MTLDAMDWVWRFSRTRGNARLALLYVADQVRTLECEIRVSTPEFMRALNTPGRGTAHGAVQSALDSGELEVVEPGRGPRGALYRLPKAVGYRRGDTATVPDSGTQSVPPSGTVDPKSVPDSGTQAEDQDRSSVPDSGTGRSGIRNASVPDSAHNNPTQRPRLEGTSEREPATLADAIPEFARPLVDSCTLAGVNVRWNLSETEWLKVHALIKRSGIQVLAAYARDQAATRRITYARYFLPGWTECPPLPRADAERPPLRAISGGYQPWTNPTNHDAYDEDL